jgi:hypothetical protein
MQDTENYPNPLKRFVLELGLVIFVIVILGLAVILALQAVNSEFTLERVRDSELLTNCKEFYLVQVYDPETEQIDSTKLSEFYRKNPDCKIYNITELDPAFDQQIFK